LPKFAEGSLAAYIGNSFELGRATSATSQATDATVAYRLDFPTHLKCHNVVHVSGQRKYAAGTKPPPPLPTIIAGEEINYEVEGILAHQNLVTGKGNLCTNT
jgi:hypothetical protein